MGRRDPFSSAVKTPFFITNGFPFGKDPFLLQHLVDPVCPFLQLPAAALEDQTLTAMHLAEFLFFDLSDHVMLHSFSF